MVCWILAMPELPAGSRNRWYRLRLPGDCRDTPLWAERFFTAQAEAFDYYERRRAEHPTGRVHRPVQSHEKPAAWVVCVDPV
jgi:hypothetical protein